MLRTFVLLLVFANLGFFAWSHGYLRAAGLGPANVAEPQRLQEQIHPERLTVAAHQQSPSQASAPAPAPPASLSASAPTASEPAAAGSAPLTATSAASGAPHGATVCLQLGPYLKGASDIHAALRAAGLAATEKRRPLRPQWMVLLGPFPDTQTLRHKLKELTDLGLRDGSFAPVRDRPHYMPGISLGVLDSEAAAQSELDLMRARGVHGAHVVQRNVDMQATTWVLSGLSPQEAAAVRKLRADALEGKKPQPCTDN